MPQNDDPKFLGIDVASYPGDATMGWLWVHGFRITGFYLNHHRGPGGEDESWTLRRSSLINAGWGLAPLYLGYQTVDSRGHHLPPPSDPVSIAAVDATESVALLNKAGFPRGSALYFDIEDGTVPSANYDSYLDAWFQGIRSAGFLPAVYCSHNLINWSKTKNVTCWSFHIPFIGGGPYDPGNLPIELDAGCVGTQFRQESHLNGLPIRLDLDCFIVPDPSSAPATTQAVA